MVSGHCCYDLTFLLLQSCLDTAVLEQNMAQCESKELLTKILKVASLSLYFDPSLLAMCWRGVGKVCCSKIGSVGTATTGTLGTGTFGTGTNLADVVRQLCLAIVTVTKQSAV